MNQEIAADSHVSPPSAAEMDRERLRSRHQVRLVPESEEGSAAGEARAGLYGFTHAPAEETMPLFCKHAFQSFEVHKLPDGAVHLVGFVTAADAAAIDAWDPGAEIRLYPDSTGDANRIVSLPADRILPAKKGPSRSEGNYLLLHLGSI